MNAVSYCRVSSTKQLAGDGPERQRSNIALFAASRFVVDREFVDDISGTKEDRPGFNEMLAYCAEHGVTTILVDKTDRFTRDLFVGLQLIATCAKAGLNVIDCSTGKSITQPENCIDQFIVKQLMLIAELNKNLLVENMAVARARIRKTKGKCEGPKGYDERPEHQQAVDAISELWSRCKSYEHIAAELNQRGVPTIKGGAWKRGTVLCVVKRLRKAGVLA